MLDPKRMLHENQIKRILTLSNDRDCLKQLDFLIALKVAEICSGRKGVRAFRYISYKKIRSQWGLKSLCQVKNS